LGWGNLPQREKGGGETKRAKDGPADGRGRGEGDGGGRISKRKNFFGAGVSKLGELKKKQEGLTPEKASKSINVKGNMRKRKDRRDWGENRAGKNGKNF